MAKTIPSFHCIGIKKDKIFFYMKHPNKIYKKADYLGKRRARGAQHVYGIESNPKIGIQVLPISKKKGRGVSESGW